MDLSPFEQTEEEKLAQQRVQAKRNLGRIGFALHEHYEERGQFPPAASVGQDGSTLLSWRVAILPYLGHKELYKQFKLDESWDGPNNKKLLEKMPPVYASVGIKTKQPHTTYYQVLVGEGTAFDNKAGNLLSDMRDGTANIIFVVEAGEPVSWTKPVDLRYDGAEPLPKLGGVFKDGIHALYVDGSVRFIKRGFNETRMRLAIGRNDGRGVNREPGEP